MYCLQPSLPFSVEWLILDEADKLFEDGKLGFRDQVRDLLRSTKAIYRRHAWVSLLVVGVA